MTTSSGLCGEDTPPPAVSLICDAPCISCSRARVRTSSGLSAIMVSSQIQAGNPTVGVTWEFTVITACVIGGVSLMGGKGRVWGTFVGVLFLSIMLNGMTLLNIDEYWQYVARAFLILGAVLIYQVQAMNARRG